MPVREGLFASAFCALIVSNVRIVAVGGTTTCGCSGLVFTWSSRGMVVVSPSVIPAVEGAALGWAFFWVDCPDNEGGWAAEGGMGSSAGCGESGGGRGKGYFSSLVGSGRMTKVGSVLHPIMYRLLGKRRGRGTLRRRTGSESGLRVGQ